MKIQENVNQYDFNVLDYLDKNCLFPKTADRELQRSYLSRMGFEQEETLGGKIRYVFNANDFAAYMSQCLHAVQDINGNLYLYNRQGYYQIEGHWLGKIVKFLMNQIVALWNQSRETAALESFRRSVFKIITNFNQMDEVNLANGILALNTKELKKHTPGFYSTIQIPFEYIADAQCTRFIQFMKEITDNDPELIAVIQEMVGYSLCHNTKAEKAFFLYGTGCNGKSILAKVITYLVGEENVASVPLSRFSETFGLASLINKTVNIAAENELTTRLNTENVKSVISGDSQNIARKYHEDVHCALSCKLIMLLNNLPNTADVTLGYFRKILIIPFPHTFTNAEIDENLFEKLVPQMPGILDWAIEGLQRLQKNNYRFSPCKRIDEVMEMYKNQQNPTALFFHDTYEPCENGRIKKSEIYGDFERWNRENGLDPVNRTTFWNMLNLQAADESKDIKILIKRVHGIDYLDGYKQKVVDTKTLNLDSPLNF